MKCYLFPPHFLNKNVPRVAIQVEITACFNRMEDLNSVKAIICMVPYNFLKTFFILFGKSKNTNAPG